MDPAIELRGVAKKYPFFSLEDINLTIPEGQIMGLIGPNGAGKSTTIRILMGLIQQDRGEVRVLGHAMPAEQVAAKWVARREVLRELTAVMTEEGRSVLFSSHNTVDVEQISDQITFIDRGRIIDSMDKEMFLEKWRRLRLEIPDGVEMPELPGIVEVVREGHLAVATADAFTPALPGVFESAGVKVQKVESMTLEEIFVANVVRSRGEVEA